MATKRDLEAIEARRVEGARLHRRRVTQAEVAQRLGVSRQAVSVWARQLEEVKGAVGKRRAKTLGRPRRLDATQCAALSAALLKGALHAGFPTELRTAMRRLRILLLVLGASLSWLAAAADFSAIPAVARMTDAEAAHCHAGARRTSCPALGGAP